MQATASCHFPFLNEWKAYCDKNKICGFVDSVLSGYAQLAFNDNTFSGILMLIATWIGSPVLFASALWATIVATLTASLIGLPKGAIRSGIYGANAALSGLAVPPLLFPSQELSLELMGVSTLIAISTVFLIKILSKYFDKWNLPSLVIPYCICFLAGLSFITVAGISETVRMAPDALLMTCSFSDWSLKELGIAFLNSASEILWLVEPVSGILYLISLLFASRLDTINTILAIIASVFVSVFLGLPKDSVMTGLYGYNAILLMQVLSRGFLINARTRIFNVCMAALTPVMCVIYQLLLTSLGISSFLALPYLTICFLVFANRRKFKNFTYVPAKYWGVPETINGRNS